MMICQSFSYRNTRGVTVLNIKLVREANGGVTLLQSHYVEKVLSRFGFSDYDPVPTPYDPSVLLRKNRRIARDQLT
jgi:hypothetical protein